MKQAEAEAALFQNRTRVLSRDTGLDRPAPDALETIGIV